jgi:chromosome segregation ATPase
MDQDTVDEIKRHFGMVAEDVRSDVRGVAEGLSALSETVDREIGAARDELASTREDLRGEVRAVANAGSTLGKEHGGLREDLGGLRGQFDGLNGQVGRLQAAVDGLREDFGEFRGNVAEEFEETRALVRLSYGQLDRRVRTLETEMADIRARLERVEGHIGG